MKGYLEAFSEGKGLETERDGTSHCRRVVGDTLLCWPTLDTASSEMSELPTLAISTSHEPASPLPTCHNQCAASGIPLAAIVKRQVSFQNISFFLRFSRFDTRDLSTSGSLLS
jgi:hypothetical protein